MIHCAESGILQLKHFLLDPAAGPICDKARKAKGTGTTKIDRVTCEDCLLWLVERGLENFDREPEEPYEPDMSAEAY